MSAGDYGMVRPYSISNNSEYTEDPKDPSQVLYVDDSADHHEECESETPHRGEADLFRVYLNEVGSVPLLNRDGERELAERMERGRERALKTLFHLPFSVRRLLAHADLIRCGAEPISELILADCSREHEPAGDRKKFFRTIGEIKRLRNQEKIAAKAYGLGLKEEFLDGIYDEIEQALHRMEDLHETLMFIDGKRVAPEEDSREKRLYRQKRGTGRNTSAHNGINVCQKHLKNSDPRWRYVECRKEMSHYENTIGASMEEIKEIRQTYLSARDEVREAKHVLIKSNLRLVVSVARRYAAYRRGLELTDLVQEGNIGLMKAINRFDYRRGCKLSTYAIWSIRQHITRSLSNHARLIRLPVHVVENLGKVARAEEELLQKAGTKTIPENPEETLDMPMGQAGTLLRMMSDPVSLDTPIGQQEGHLIDLIEDRAALSPLDQLIGHTASKHIRNSLSVLDSKEEKIIRSSFGIDEEVKTLAELGREFGISRERVRQIKESAIKKLRSHLGAVSL